ncbi:MAG: aminoacyl-tRNA hydrolase [Candidatus Gracilibacteria bacterium]
MKLIVGLGNPGKDYEFTRHNLGFLFLDYLKEKKGFSDFKEESKFKGSISNGFIKGEKTILLKPLTYMNISGESLRKVVDFYKVDLEDMIVIYDDISMDFGKIRFKDTGSAGGHNGVKSIISHFGDKWKRIKVGIGLNTNYDVSDWVLSKFTKDELDNLQDEIFYKIYDLVSEKI